MEQNLQQENKPLPTSKELVSVVQYFWSEKSVCITQSNFDVYCSNLELQDINRSYICELNKIKLNFENEYFKAKLLNSLGSF